MIPVKISRILLIIIACGILVLSLIPDTPSITGLFSDKATHLVAYGFLSCFFIFAFASGRIHFVLLSLISILICTLYGGIIEILQNFTQRSPELADFIADFAGSVTGTFLALGFVRLVKKHQS